MEYKLYDDTYIVRLEKGEELVESLKKLCEKEKVQLASVQAIGASDHVVVGLYDVDKQQYYKKELNEAFEITSLVGNAATMNEEIYLHLHINLADENMKLYGGHLYECRISATLEMFVRKINGKIDRIKDETTGLNILSMQ